VGRSGQIGRDHSRGEGTLNSSTACFWLREDTHDKGNRGEGGVITSAAWERFHQYDSTRIKDLPLPADLPLDFGRELDALGQQLAAASTREEDEHTRNRMIALQEELDWDVYHRYSLLTDEQAAHLTSERESRNLTEEALRAWHPPQAQRGRRSSS